MSENLLNEVEYPFNKENSENPEISEIVKNGNPKKPTKTKKRSLLKPLLLVLSLLLLMAAILAGLLYIVQSGQNPFNSILKQVTLEPATSKSEAIMPVDIQRISLVKTEIPSQPPHIKNDRSETPNLLNGIDTALRSKPANTPAENNTVDHEPNPSKKLSVTPEILADLHNDLIAEIDLKDKEILIQISALNNAIQSIEGSIVALNQKLSRYEQRTSETDHELSNIKKFISDVNTKVKKVSYLVKKQEKKVLSKKIKQASPPELSSFAIWNGKNAVYVEYPKGKLTMMYEGDIVNSWLVKSINPVKKEAVFKRGDRTEVLSIGGKK